MKKWIVFLLLSVCALGLVGCSKEDPVAFGHAIICPDCGGYRNEDAETCPICVRNEALKEWLKSEQNDENISIQIDN